MSEIDPPETTETNEFGVFRESDGSHKVEQLQQQLEQLKQQLASTPGNARSALEANPALKRFLDGTALAESIESILLPGRTSQEALEQMESEALADLFGAAPPARVIGGNL